MGETVEFPSNGHTCGGYLATPPSGRGPGVVVIQEYWGVNAHVRDLCDRFAAEGFVALAPDLDRRFERLYGYLNDDVTRRRATIGLSLELCGASAWSAAAQLRSSGF